VAQKTSTGVWGKPRRAVRGAVWLLEEGLEAAEEALRNKGAKIAERKEKGEKLVSFRTTQNDGLKKGGGIESKTLV